MKCRKRQVYCNLRGNAIKVQAGAMQWTAGNVVMSSGINGAKDFLGKAFKSMATNESTAKLIYSGKILMAPVGYGTTMSQKNSSSEPAKTSSGSFLGSVVGSVLDL